MLHGQSTAARARSWRRTCACCQQHGVDHVRADGVHCVGSCGVIACFNEVGFDGLTCACPLRVTSYHQAAEECRSLRGDEKRSRHSISGGLPRVLIQLHMFSNGPTYSLISHGSNRISTLNFKRWLSPSLSPPRHWALSAQTMPFQRRQESLFPRWRMLRFQFRC